MSLLYLKHFDLRKSPFQITPDADFFFSGSQRGGILSALTHVACHEEGIATAVAEVGSGKTMLARLMISRLPANISTVYLANPCFTRDEILGAICRDLGLLNIPVSTEEKLARLHQELLRRHALGMRVLLVIDEAHLMPVESLEEVRLLSNLETSHHKLVNIMLFGQPELDILLSEHRLRQVRDRVIHRFELPPLTLDEASAYIDHRLRIAGWRGGRLFTAPAIALLIKSSGGRARRINLLADKSLLSAFVDNAVQIEKRHVKQACQELYTYPKIPFFSRFPNWRTSFSQLVLAATAIGSITWMSSGNQANATAQASLPVNTIHSTETTHKISKNPYSKSAENPSRQSPQANPSKSLKLTNRTSESQAAKPEEAPRIDFIIRNTEELLRMSKLQGFTIQLAALPSVSNIPSYFSRIAKHVDASEIYAQNQTYDGREYVAIYVGQYLTENDAKLAMSKFPEPLRANQYSIRAWATINREAIT